MIDKHWRSNVDFHLPVQPAFFSSEVVSALLDLQADEAEGVRINGYRIAENDRHRRMALGRGAQRHSPQYFAGSRLETHQGIGGKIKDLLCAGERRGDERRVGSLFALRLPQNLAG